MKACKAPATASNIRSRATARKFRHASDRQCAFALGGLAILPVCLRPKFPLWTQAYAKETPGLSLRRLVDQTTMHNGYAALSLDQKFILKRKRFLPEWLLIGVRERGPQRCASWQILVEFDTEVIVRACTELHTADDRVIGFTRAA